MRGLGQILYVVHENMYAEAKVWPEKNVAAVALFEAFHSLTTWMKLIVTDIRCDFCYLVNFTQSL